MPGHWLLARLGKRVLRPGGLELTKEMLNGLAICHTDHVVEFAPGLGVTAAMTLRKVPASYRAVERDADAATNLAKRLKREQDSVVAGRAEETGLPDKSASVVYGEAMLSMQTENDKKRIISEAARILKGNGRYGIHELCLRPDDVSDDVKHQIEQQLSQAIHVGARPLTAAEWKALLEGEGFNIKAVYTKPFALLEPSRLIRDEGLFGAMRFMSRAIRDGDARKRVFAMRRCFREHADHLCAIAIVAEKRDAPE
jgi:SAM-dependent methyltransferase